jgi:hypothetical protein
MFHNFLQIGNVGKGKQQKLSDNSHIQVVNISFRREERPKAVLDDILNNPGNDTRIQLYLLNCLLKVSICILFIIFLPILYYW